MWKEVDWKHDLVLWRHADYPQCEKWVLRSVPKAARSNQLSAELAAYKTRMGWQKDRKVAKRQAMQQRR